MYVHNKGCVTYKSTPNNKVDDNVNSTFYVRKYC